LSRLRRFAIDLSTIQSNRYNESLDRPDFPLPYHMPNRGGSPPFAVSQERRVMKHLAMCLVSGAVGGALVWMGGALRNDSSGTSIALVGRSAPVLLPMGSASGDLSNIDPNAPIDLRLAQLGPGDLPPLRGGSTLPPSQAPASQAPAPRRSNPPAEAA